MKRRLGVLIVDDEPLARDCVRLALRNAPPPEVQVVGECGDGAEAVAQIQALAPDLVFLDVHMPGLSGFDVIERVGPERMPAVIFVTAYEEHAVRAFTVHALDYLLKPFDDPRFHDALAHARRSLGGERGQGRRLQALLQEERRQHEGGRYATWITVLVRDSHRLLRVDDVDWFEAEGNYVRVQIGSEEHLVRSTLGAILERLDPARFARIHRSVVVNLTRVRAVEPGDSGDYLALLQDGRCLRVSRSYRDALLAPLR